jgi:hypothetical protein
VRQNYHIITRSQSLNTENSLFEDFLSYAAGHYSPGGLGWPNLSLSQIKSLSQYNKDLVT